jgi:hypothetical protein
MCRRYRSSTLLLILTVILLSACESKRERAKALIVEANVLLTQDTKLTKEWTSEYAKYFSPENLANFPANRESLRGKAERILMLLDESSRLSSQIADKFGQASAAMDSADAKRGLSLFAESSRKQVGILGLFKAQMRWCPMREFRTQRPLTLISRTQLRLSLKSGKKKTYSRLKPNA